MGRFNTLLLCPECCNFRIRLAVCIGIGPCHDPRWHVKRCAGDPDAQEVTDAGCRGRDCCRWCCCMVVLFPGIFPRLSSPSQPPKIVNRCGLQRAEGEGWGMRMHAFPNVHLKSNSIRTLSWQSIDVWQCATPNHSVHVDVRAYCVGILDG
jgi:hypothetical protein